MWLVIFRTNTFLFGNSTDIFMTNTVLLGTTIFIFGKSTVIIRTNTVILCSNTVRDYYINRIKKELLPITVP